MAEFREQDLSNSSFYQVRLHGSTFEEVDASGVTIRNATLQGAQFRTVMLNGMRMRGVEMVGVDIYGEINDVTINGVAIAPLIQAELDRRYPERPLMRPTNADGFRLAWDTIERLWAATIERARRVDPAVLHEHVDDEWSFIQTLRHLVFATESWLLRVIKGNPTPWHPLSLPWDEAPPTPGVPHDREAKPDLDTALELRADRMSQVREYMKALTDETLAAMTEPVNGPGWPEPQPFPVRECLLVILNEEWEHRLYAERDLTILDTRVK